MTGQPRRGYSWPPFEPGNDAAKTHGAQSSAVLTPIAEILQAELVAAAPWCAGPTFAMAVRRWAWAEAVCHQYRAHFDQHGLFDDDGEPLPGLERWDRAEARAAKAAERLGVDPTSWARLLESLAPHEGEAGEEIEALRSVGRDLVARRQAAIEAASKTAEDEESM